MPTPDGFPDADAEERFHVAVAKVLEGAFIASSLGMPTEDARTAMDVIWASFEALLVQHFPAGEDHPGPPVVVPDGTHWSRILVTAVTNSLLIGGTFVRPVEAARGVAERASALRAGDLWRTRRPPGPGAVVLATHAVLLRLDETAETGRDFDAADGEGLGELVALAALGAVLCRDDTVPAGRASAERARAEVDAVARATSRRAREMADLFGVAGVLLVPVERTGWACDACGCVFAGRVESGVAYPDRLAPVGRGGPCDVVTECACHDAPLQRRVD